MLATPLDKSAWPSDLRGWIPENQLIRLALEAVQVVDWRYVRTESSLLPAGQAPMLMTVLVYCYASGVFRSREIEQLAQTDNAVRYLCAYRALDWNTVRLFRRQHARELTLCLAAVLETAWAWKLSELESAEVPAGYAQSSLNRWVSPDPKLRVLEVAQSRVAKAVRVDSMEMDD